ncbi:NAD(P)-binding protein [Myriangium duriaei CBS 260.36]|uniref:NAD(P)-binding protein n=1 Tax=Myriangium duriaei CBS 260.36 TaxID=1168546 RepID=A0A9P4MLG3_9PEZI|nr:NAD(P)-binding protein [Myriangium duriaei CBS 260.36]
MSAPLAIITGGSSGIGLALTQHLLTLSYRVAILDLQPPLTRLPQDTTLYIPTNVASYPALASAFAKAHSWAGHRLDFVALNAGIDDRDDIFASLSQDVENPPKAPNMLTFEVDLYGPYYGLKLAAHYMALNTPVKGGKVVITASAAGLRGAPVIPQYSACKHALVGLTRSLAPRAKPHGITINAICPAIVATGLAPPGLMDKFAPEQVTPMSTIIRAFEELWVRGGHNGQVVEADLGELYYRQQVQDTPSAAGGHSGDKASKIWGDAYLERNKKFALADWEGKGKL